MNRLLLVSDTTGSMSPVIRTVRKNLIKISKEVLRISPDTEIGVMFHGDWCDGQRGISWSGWTDAESLGNLEYFISETRGTSGGDSPEFYEQVLHAMTTLDWGDGAKVAVMVGDVYPHGYTEGGNGRGNLNNFEQRTHKGSTISLDLPLTGAITDWKSESETLAKMGVILHPVHARNTRTTFWRELADAGQGVLLAMTQFQEVPLIVTSSFHASTSPDSFKDYLSSVDEGSLSRAMANNFASFSAWLGDDSSAARFKRASEREDLFGSRRPSPARHISYSSYSSTPPAGHEDLDERHFIMLEVTAEDTLKHKTLKSLVEDAGLTWKQGNAFYELGGQKKRQIVQERKQVVVRDKDTGDMFSGAKARDLIGLPYGRRGSISPNVDGNPRKQVFIQSTSPNRKPIRGMYILYKNPEY